jgi:hypothetical protein
MKTIAIALFVALLPFAADASAQRAVRGAQDSAAAAPSVRVAPMRSALTPHVRVAPLRDAMPNMAVRPHDLSPRAGRVAGAQKLGASPGARAARIRRAVADARARGIELDPQRLRRLQQRTR